MLRKHFTIIGCALMLGTLAAGQRAEAAPVHFHFVGGAWGRVAQPGWHRYWGGPEIGFYFAAAPVYVVDGYAAPYYYSGPDFWYGNPAFGLSLSFGGGGYYGGGYRVRDFGGSGYRVHEFGGEHGGFVGAGDHGFNGAVGRGFSGGSHNFGAAGGHGFSGGSHSFSSPSRASAGGMHGGGRSFGGGGHGGGHGRR